MPLNICFILLHIFSMGFKSGLYAGKNRQLADRDSTNSRAAFDLCGARLSITTTSPGRMLGPRMCSIYASNSTRSTAPSNMRHSVSPSRRIDDSIVCVSHCPAGALSWQRFPLRARPYRRVILVLAPDSSRKTNRYGATVAWNWRHRSRCVAMSARSCSLARRVFFNDKSEFRNNSMYRGEAAVFAKMVFHLSQSHINILLE